MATAHSVCLVNHTATPVQHAYSEDTKKHMSRHTSILYNQCLRGVNSASLLLLYISFVFTNLFSRYSSIKINIPLIILISKYVWSRSFYERSWSSLFHQIGFLKTASNITIISSYNKGNEYCSQYCIPKYMAKYAWFRKNEGTSEAKRIITSIFDLHYCKYKLRRSRNPGSSSLQTPRGSGGACRTQRGTAHQEQGTEPSLRLCFSQPD